MRRRSANYGVVESTPEALTIRDLGPWDQFLTVTNAAEEVVEELARSGRLNGGKKLLYYDSEGELTELLHEGGKFRGFAPA